MGNFKSADAAGMNLNLNGMKKKGRGCYVPGYFRTDMKIFNFRVLNR